MTVNVRYVDSSVLGSCPASVDMRTGVVSINRDVWDRYDQFERNFVLMHEIGHFVLDTDSEYEADAYALRNVYKTAPRSLKRSLQTLCKIRVVDPTRLNRLYEEALRLDAADGNYAAAVELREITGENFFSNQKSRKMTKNRGQQTYLEKSGTEPDYKIVRRADGNRGHGQNGIRIGDWYFSITNILLAVIVVLLWSKN